MTPAIYFVRPNRARRDRRIKPANANKERSREDCRRKIMREKLRPEIRRLSARLFATLEAEFWTGPRTRSQPIKNESTLESRNRLHFWGIYRGKFFRVSPLWQAHGRPDAFKCLYGTSRIADTPIRAVTACSRDCEAGAGKLRIALLRETHKTRG